MDRFLWGALQHTGGGGLLASNGSSVTLDNTKFLYNGAIAGALATIRGGAFNTPLASGGGGIAAYGGAHLNIKKSTFDYNNMNGVGTNGGAINMLGEDSVLNVALSHFTNNTASRTGGAIRVKDGDVTISGSLLKNNGVTGTFIGDESGGGLGVINSNVTVTASVFQKNFVTGTGLGGGLLFHVPFDTGEPYTVVIKNSLFDSNVGGLFGGGGIGSLGNDLNPGTHVSVSNTVFMNNFGWMGGGVLADSVPTTITNTLFYRNKAPLIGAGMLSSNLSAMIRGQNGPANSVSNSIFKENTIVPMPATLPPLAALPPNFPADIGTVSFVLDVFLGVLTQVFNPTAVPVSHLLAPINIGGGGIAVEFGSTLNVSNTSFIKNSAPGGAGGSVLVWGLYGVGPNGIASTFNTNTVTLSNLFCYQNTAADGNNAKLLLPPAGLIPAGVTSTLTTDGSCP